jgi:hypothetical protein
MSAVPQDWRWLLVGLAAVAWIPAATVLPAAGRPSVGIFEYIRRTWPVLTRTHAGLAAAAVFTSLFDALSAAGQAELRRQGASAE